MFFEVHAWILRLSFPGTFIDFCFMIFTKLLMKYLALINCRVSFKVLFSMWLVIVEKEL